MNPCCIVIMCLGSLPVLAFIVVGYLCHKADQARFKEYKEYYTSLKKDEYKEFAKDLKSGN